MRKILLKNLDIFLSYPKGCNMILLFFNRVVFIENFHNLLFAIVPVQYGNETGKNDEL